MSTATKTRPPASDLPPDNDETGDDTAAIAKALGHPARIQIVRLLLEKQSCFGCDMVDEVKLAQSTVSEHLRILKSAGIITGEIEHPRVCYSLNPDSLMPLGALLNAVFDKHRRGEIGGSICCPPSGRNPEKPTSRLLKKSQRTLRDGPSALLKVR